MQGDPQRATSCHQNVSKTVKNSFQGGPKAPESLPRGPQEARKRPPRGPKRPPDGLKRPPRGFQEGPRERYSETCFIKVFFHVFLIFLTKITIILYFTVRFGPPEAETLYFTVFHDVRRERKSALQGSKPREYCIFEKKNNK